MNPNIRLLSMNKVYFEIIQNLLKDEFPEPGSARKRKSNAPEMGKTTLTEVKNA